MRRQGSVPGGSLSWRARSLLGVIAALLTVGLGPTVAPAAAEIPAHTDVMLLFDTSGSMSGELGEAKANILEVMEQAGAELPDTKFGVSEVKDYPSNEAEPEGETPWKLDLALTADRNAVKSAIEPLSASGGGDSPEAYGRALFEADTNPNVGWREGARHVIILVADDVPHDKDLDEGVPSPPFLPPFDTGEELPGLAGIPGSLWGTTPTRDFQSLMTQLRNDGKPLEAVEFFGTESKYLPYWEYWAGLAGGKALNGGTGELASALTKLIKEGATAALPGCPAGQVRNGSGVCVVVHPSVTQVICNLIIATASDTCTATVADAAPTGASNPTGTVKFTSANGGVFSAGDTCTLTPTPLSPNVSSCSVQFLPPSAPSTLPAITAAYSGDGLRAASKGQTHYGPASSLAEHVSLDDIGTITEGSAVIPIECGFPCSFGGELLNQPDLATLTSVSAVTAAKGKSKGKKHHKKHKPVLLGKGSVKLAKAGKGKLVLKLTPKGRRALGHVGRKGVRLTLAYTVRTLNGTLVTKKKAHIKLKPAKRAKGHGHHKH